MLKKVIVAGCMVIGCLCLVSGCDSPPPGGQAAPAGDSKVPDTKQKPPLSVTKAPSHYVPDRLLVKPRSGADLSLLDKLHDRYKAKVLRTIPRIGIQVVQLPQGSDVMAVANHYRETGLVKYANPDYLIYAEAIPNDPMFGGLWGLNNTGQPGGLNNNDPLTGTAGADINARYAWDHITDASGVVVAVLDSGIRYTHEDLAGNMWRNPGETGTDANGNDKATNGIDDDNNCYIDDVFGASLGPGDPAACPGTDWRSGDPMDNTGHGSHVAGTIGAVANNGKGIAGIAWDVQLMAVKFIHPPGNENNFCFNPQSLGCGDTSDAIELFIYAVDQGVDIFNASFGNSNRTQADEWEDALQIAKEAGVIFVGAAGNGGGDGTGDDNDNPGPSGSVSPPEYPSSLPHDNIVAVAATDRNDQLASFSNFGHETVDLAAPGVGILSTWGDNDANYIAINGTSMAAPHVSGALALLKARYPDEHYTALIQRLLANVTPLPNLAGRVRSGGRLNLERAITTPLATGFALTPRSGPGPLTVQFLNKTIGNVMSHTWDFGDGNQSTQSNPIHTYQAPGTYYPTLSVTGGNNVTQVATSSVLVMEPFQEIEDEMVTVADACNMADGLARENGSIPAYGAVSYEFELGKYEITNGQYAAFLNAVASNDTHGLFDPQMEEDIRGGIKRAETAGYVHYRVKPDMGVKPVVFVSRYDAMRFANWLHNGQPVGVQNDDTTENGAYRITADAVVNQGFITRNDEARFFLPSLDEWYKAAYYKGGSMNAGYWMFPAQSDSVPVAATAFDNNSPNPGVISNPDNDASPPDGVANYANQAVWNIDTNVFGIVTESSITSVGTAGSDSTGFYGTYDQGGNAAEWLEDSNARIGGDSVSPPHYLGSLPVLTAADIEAHPYNIDVADDGAFAFTGFRVARIQDPSTMRRSIDGKVVECNGDVGSFSAIAVDQTGRYHIAYYKRDNQGGVVNGSLKYAVSFQPPGDSPLRWLIETVDSGGDVGRYLSLALDNNGIPHISYYDAGNGRLKLAGRLEGQWVTEVVDEGENGKAGQFTSLVFDADNNPHISYIELVSPNQLAGAVTDNLPPTIAGLVGIESSEFRINEDFINLGFNRDYGGIVKYATRVNGVWQIEIVDDGRKPAPGLNTVRPYFRFTSLAINAEGEPHIAYQDIVNGDLLYSQRALVSPVTPHPFVHQTVVHQTFDESDRVSAYPSLGISSNGKIAIAYYDAHNKNMILVREDQVARSTDEVDTLDIISNNVMRIWLKTIVDSQGDVGKFASLRFDENDAIHIAYYDAAGKGIKHAVSEGPGWNINTVISNNIADMGSFVSMALSDENSTAFSYYDATNGDLMFTLEE